MGRAISRRYRPPRIGELLKELDLAEGRSTGIPKILRAMRENGLPAPLFESDDERTWFLTRLPVHDQAHGMLTGQVTQQDTPQDDRHVADHVEQLEAALSEEMSRAQLQEVLRLKDRNHFTKKYLRPSLEAGVIEMVIPGKATSGNQRYRRTAVGAALARHVNAVGHATQQDTQQDAPQVTPQVTARVQQLVAVLTGAMSGARLQERLKLRDRNHFTAAYLRPALEAGLESFRKVLDGLGQR